MRVNAYRFMALAMVGLVLAFGAQSCSHNDQGVGTLALTMGYQNTASAPSPVTTQSEDFGSGNRTPISDLILTFHSVQAWSCTGDDSLEDHDGDDDSTHADSTGEAEDTDEHCDAFTVLNDSTVTLSAGTLDSTLTLFLGNALLPQGDYDFLTLGNASAQVVTAAGETLDAKVPSGRIKVLAPFNISDGGTTDLLVVFDLNRSVVEAPPGSKNFIVKPVVHSQTGWDHENND